MYRLVSNVNFGSGFNTITLPTFIDLGTSDFFRIINGGTGNSGGQISGVSINQVPLPAALPLFAAGLGVLGLLGQRVANDRRYLGDRVNGRLANALGLVFLVIIVVAAVASIPLLLFTGMGGY